MPCSYEMHRLSALAKYLEQIAREKRISIEKAIEYLVNRDEGDRGYLKEEGLEP